MSSALMTFASGILLASASSTLAVTIYVDDSAPPTGANDGTSWEDAFTNLHDGFKAAVPGDEVRIAQGTYRPAEAAGDRTVSFQLPSGAIVQGGYAGAGAPNPDALDPVAFLTMISGDLNGDDGPIGSFANFGDNSHNVLAANGVAEGTQLHGVTISGGNADDFENCMSQDDFARGGGIIVHNGAVLAISNVKFEGNQAVCIGGAIAVRENSSLDVSDSTFRYNRNQLQGGWGAGGAISNFTGTLRVSNCLFESNGQSEAGAAVHGLGNQNTQIRKSRFVGNISSDGGGALAGSGFAVMECTFIGNTASLWGGAAHLYNSTFVNCSFLDNSASCTGRGGAIRSHGGNLHLFGCHFAGNSHTALVINPASQGPSTIINSTFVGNDGTDCTGGAPGAVAAIGPLTMANSILWDNLGDADDAQQSQLSVSISDAAISHTIIEGWDGTLGGANNFGKDPLFADADGPDNQYGTEDDNARLTANSPAIDAGDNAFLPSDQFDLDEDGDTAELIPLDLDDQARIVNEIVDLGAYEFDGEPVCTADIAPEGGNGTVDIDDLLLVINNWGATGDNPADITGNGTVDVDDLLAVINAWGDCSS